MTPKEHRARLKLRAADLYRSGMVMREIAAELGRSRHWVWHSLNEQGLGRGDGGLQVKPRRLGLRDQDRAAGMAALYRAGKTLQEIGDEYGVTRERVRQILRVVGVMREDGGRATRSKKSLAQRRAARDARYLRRYGCTFAEYKAIRGAGPYRTSPLCRYLRQEHNAKHRGIEWQITLKEWWAIWEASGKWNERGRGSGYVMARLEDSGPYAVGNVHIVHSVENSLEYYGRVNDRFYAETRKRWGLAA